MKKRVHFIGIGGSGMFPLSLLAAEKGYAVSGSDRNLSAKKKQELDAAGIKFTGIPDENSLPDTEMVVFSSAVKPDHPERKKARQFSEQNRILLMHRMDFLNHLIKDKEIRIGISGTHGKTSTSSMLGYILLRAGMDPDILVGGHPLYLEKGMRCGNGRTAVFETDESDGSFLRSNANYRICLNADNDHLDYYQTKMHLDEAFRKFADEGEISVLNGDDSALNSVFEKTFVYFFDGIAERSIKSRFPAYHLNFLSEMEGAAVHRIQSDGSDEMCGKFKLVMPGKHFYLNALSIIALLDSMRSGGISDLPDTNDICRFLSQFPGVERRMQKIAELDGVEVYDDYGHHPTELRAVLSSLRNKLKAGSSLRAVFQPHRYTRTGEHFKAFAEVLSIADEVYLLPLYSSGELPIDGVSSKLIADHTPPGRQFLMIEADQLGRAFAGAEAGDIIVFLGAGDISYLAGNYLNTRSV